MARQDAKRFPDPAELAFLQALDASRRVARTRRDLPGGSEQSVNAMRQRCSAAGWTRHGRDAAGRTGWLLRPARVRARAAMEGAAVTAPPG